MSTVSSDNTASSLSNSSLQTQTPTPLHDEEHFKRAIHDWVAVDNSLTQVLNQAKELRQMRTSLTPAICNYIERQQCQNMEIKLKDSSLSYKVEKVQPGISQKFVQEGLVAYFRDVCNDEHAELRADECMQFIKSRRKVETKAVIKRKYMDE